MLLDQRPPILMCIATNPCTWKQEVRQASPTNATGSTSTNTDVYSYKPLHMEARSGKHHRRMLLDQRPPILMYIATNPCTWNKVRQASPTNATGSTSTNTDVYSYKPLHMEARSQASITDKCYWINIALSHVALGEILQYI